MGPLTGFQLYSRAGVRYLTISPEGLVVGWARAAEQQAQEEKASQEKEKQEKLEKLPRPTGSKPRSW